MSGEWVSTAIRGRCLRDGRQTAAGCAALVPRRRGGALAAAFARARDARQAHGVFAHPACTLRPGVRGRSWLVSTGSAFSVGVRAGAASRGGTGAGVRRRALADRVFPVSQQPDPRAEVDQSGQVKLGVPGGHLGVLDDQRGRHVAAA